MLELGAKHFKGRRRPLTGDASGWNLCFHIMLVLGSAMDLLSLIALVTPVLLLLPLVAGSSCIGLSLYRLVTITSLEQYGSSGPDDPKANVWGALIFFYVLVLVQGGLYIISLCIRVYRLRVRGQVCLEYQFTGKDRILIDKYINRTLSACIRTGVLNTINRKLTSFAVDLLHSEYSQDRVSGVRVLHTLTSNRNEVHKDRTIAHIKSSPDCIARMFVLLSSKSSMDENSKLNLAQIVTEISKELRLSDIDGATESISSLIDPYLTKISTLSGENNRPLIIHGLEILAKLAQNNPDNCTKLFSTEDLFSKIVAPISNKLYTITTDDERDGMTAIEITQKSLRVVSKLVQGTHDINEKIRHKICSLVLVWIYPILELEQHPRYNRLKVLAIKILSQLKLVNKFNYIDLLLELLFDESSESSIRKDAAKALVLLASDSCNTANSAIMMNWIRPRARSFDQKLLTMLSDASYQNALAQILTKFCVNFPDDQTSWLLKSILKKVLNVIICQVDKALGTNMPSDSEQQNRCPAAEFILRFLVPCIETSQCLGGDNGGNRRSALTAPLRWLQVPFSCFGACSPANRRNQSEGSGSALQNQTVVGSPNPREDEGGDPAQGTLTSLLCCLNGLFNVPNIGRGNGNLRGNRVQTQPANTPIKPGNRKTLLAFLDLALQICEKLSDAAAFNFAVSHRAQLVDKLGMIIGMCNKDAVGLLKGRGPSDDYLRMIKSATKLCAWVMEKNQSYVEDFRQKDIDHKLEAALEAMKGLELGVVLTYSADQRTSYKTLSSIVENAKKPIAESRERRSPPQRQQPCPAMFCCMFSA